MQEGDVGRGAQLGARLAGVWGGSPLAGDLEGCCVQGISKGEEDLGKPSTNVHHVEKGKNGWVFSSLFLSEPLPEFFFEAIKWLGPVDAPVLQL